MLILIDTGFPATLSNGGTMEVEFVYASFPWVSDLDMIETASQIPASAVIFLGIAPLLNAQLLTKAVSLRIALLATQETNPIEAERIVMDHVVNLPRVLSFSDPFVMLTRELKKLSDYRYDID